jgi:putative peptide zinc metalloprotease protein
LAVDRPTFSESWYRVNTLRPRLRSTVQIYRQHYRGRMWHVIQDPSNNQFFRVNEPAYRFVAMLDGRRTVAEVWRICNEQLGDEAPTQNEVIQLLGQLYASNLLQGDMPPDAEGLFKRYRKRVQREVKGYVTNFLFIRIPLFDPDAFLDRWVNIFGKVFSKAGFVLWLILVCAALYTLTGSLDRLEAEGERLFDRNLLVDNLPWLYLSFVMIKVFHEFGHGFACKKFGQDAGSGGEVHTMGIMFLVFTPLPYVDASSAWAYRNKWHRIIVGAAGILIEIGLASIAALVWANTSPGPAHQIAFNVMFIASVSTILFNANPLLRYDGYYILSDILEIPNLSQRSKEYIYYLVKKYVWGVRNPRNPAHSPGEKAWMAFYGVASTFYRVFICYRILMFIADRFFMLGLALAAAAVVAWVLVPLGKFVHYLATSGELSRVRGRAIATTLIFLAVVVGAIGTIPVSDHERGEGVVEPIDMEVVRVRTEGFVRAIMPTDREVSPDGPPLMTAENHELLTEYKKLKARRKALRIQYKQDVLEDMAKAESTQRMLNALEREIEQLQQDLDHLEPHAGIAGTWVSPQSHRMKGVYLKKGQPIGTVLDLSTLRIRAIASQDLAVGEVRRVEIRVKNRPPQYKKTGFIDLDPDDMTSREMKVLPAARRELPSEALSYQVGGSVATDPDTRNGVRATERQFEIWIEVPDERREILLPGQRVEVRFELPPRPLAYQWARDILQLVQKRFKL